MADSYDPDKSQLASVATDESVLFDELKAIAANLRVTETALFHYKNATATFIPTAGKQLQGFIKQIQASMSASAPCKIAVDDTSVLVIMPVFPRNTLYTYYITYIFHSRLFRKPRDVDPLALSRLRGLLLERELKYARQTHQFATASVLSLLKGFLNENPFQRTLEFLLQIFNCKSGSIWEHHDNSAYGSTSYITLEATAGQNFFDYRHNCSPEDRGPNWRVLKPHSPKYLHTSVSGPSELLNEHLYDEYRSPFLLVRLEADGETYGVACLTQVTEYDKASADTALEMFEKIAALEVRNKRTERDSRILRQLGVPHPDVTTIGEACKGVVSNVRNILNCEGASLFLAEGLDPKSKRLELFAVDFDTKLSPSDETRRFLSGDSFSYMATPASLTAQVYLHSKTIISNEVSKEPRNSNRFREISNKDNDTWIGVPIYNTLNLCIGVIRCTGKRMSVQETSVRYIFDATDAHLLQYFARSLAPTLATIQSVSSLEALNQRLAKSEKFREHEMKGPLNTIIANAESVLQFLNVSSGVNKEQRLQDIVSDAQLCSFLLCESRIPTRHDFSNRLCVATISQMIGELRASLTRLINAKPRDDGSNKAYLRVDIRGAAGAALVHRELLQRVFYNVGINAVKYAREGGTLIIIMFEDRSDKTIHVDFEDDGIGINDDDIPKLFNEGVRGSNVQTKEYEGLGLGLYFSRQIMTLHGGAIDLVSPRIPTKFRLTLPIGDFSRAAISSTDLAVLRDDPPKRVK